MLTKADKKFLTEKFASKADLKDLAKQKDVLNTQRYVIAMQKDVSGLKTAVGDLQTDTTSIKSTLEEVKDDVSVLTDAVGNILEWTDNIHRAIVGKATK